MRISWAGVLLLLARAGALHPLGWPACRLPQSPLRVALAGCTGLAAARRSRSLSCAALDQHARTERTPGAVSRAPVPRLCAEALGRPAGVVPGWRRWLAAVAKSVLRLLSFLLPAWLMRRLPLRRPREPEEQLEVQPEVRQPPAAGAADAAGRPQQPTSEVVAIIDTPRAIDTSRVRAFDVDGIAILRLYPLPTTTPTTSREATAAAAAAATASAAAAATASVAATASAAAAATASAAAATASAAAIASASASPSGSGAPVEWQNALFDFGNRIGRGNDAATPAVLLDEVRPRPTSAGYHPVTSR